MNRASRYLAPKPKTAEDSLSAGSKPRRDVRWMALDLLIIALLSLVAQGTHYSAQRGRAVLCGDSVQYVAAAEALLDPDATPHFEMRKPGYIFLLAGIGILLGNMGWAAIVTNHVMLALLPLVSYGFGFLLRNRLLAWVCAVLTIVRLQQVLWGNRMLSESLFMLLCSAGVLLLLKAISSSAHRRWFIGAGSLLGLSWLTRGTATPIIAAGALCILVSRRSNWRHGVVACGCFTAPVLACILFECGLNEHYAGQFRPSNGTSGATVLLRATHFEGLAFPETTEAQEVLSLLPERDAARAYTAHHVDVWIARYRAIHDRGMGEWEYDDLMGRVGAGMILGNLGAYAVSTAKLFAWHLLRLPDGQELSTVTRSRRAPPIIHPDARVVVDWGLEWFGYYGLPHMSKSDSRERVGRVTLAASTPRTIGPDNMWRTLRYWRTKPVVRTLEGLLLYCSHLWPVLALIGAPWLLLRRSSCLTLGVIFIIEALFVGLLTPTNTRLQSTWLVADTCLAAGLIVGAAGVAAGWVRSQYDRLCTHFASSATT